MGDNQKSTQICVIRDEKCAGLVGQLWFQVPSEWRSNYPVCISLSFATWSFSAFPVSLLCIVFHPLPCIPITSRSRTFTPSLTMSFFVCVFVICCHVMKMPKLYSLKYRRVSSRWVSKDWEFRSGWVWLGVCREIVVKMSAETSVSWRLDPGWIIKFQDGTLR